MKGNAVESWIGMPNAVEAPTGLSMKLMPIAMIALGTKIVHQNSGEFFFNVEVSVPVVIFIVHMVFLVACDIDATVI
jgi:hypothetical protein